MTQFIETLKLNLPKVFEEKPFLEKQKRFRESLTEVQDRIMSEVAADAKKHQIAIATTEKGYQAVPLKDGNPMSEEAFEKLDPTVRADMEKELIRVQQQMKEAVARIQKESKKCRKTTRNWSRKLPATCFLPKYRHCLRISMNGTCPDISRSCPKRPDRPSADTSQIPGPGC